MNTTVVAPNKLEDISRKFGKLMAKAKSTDFATEAEQCVALAQKLLWDSSLEEAQLLSLADLEKRAKRVFVKDGIYLGDDKYVLNRAFNSRNWKSELLYVLVDSFFCKTLNAYSKTVQIVGEPNSVAIVKNLYAYLEKQIRASRRVAFNLAKEQNEIDYASTRYWGRSNKPNLSQFAVHAFKNSFASGAVAIISRRLSEQQRENIECADQTHETSSGQIAIGFGAALVVQIQNELDEAFYEFFPELHPAAVALARYKQDIEYRERTAELNRQRVEHEARIEAGLEPAFNDAPPEKEYRRRGRKPQYRGTMDNNAYKQGRVAGNSMQINPAINGSRTSLNK